MKSGNGRDVGGKQTFKYTYLNYQRQMDSDVILELSNHFSSLNNQARKELECEKKMCLQRLDLESIDPQQGIVRIRKERDRNKKKILHFKRREYYLLADDLENLKKLFFARLVFFFREENFHLKTALVIRGMEKFLERLLIEAESRLYSFTQPGPGQGLLNMPDNWPRVEPIYHRSYQAGTRCGMTIIEAFKEKYSPLALSEKRYDACVNARLYMHWNELNELKDLQLYKLQDNIPELKRYFAEKCQGGDIEFYASELRKARALKVRNTFLIGERSRIDKENFSKTMNQLNCQQIIADLLCRLVPNLQIIEEFNDLNELVKQESEMGRPLSKIKKEYMKTFEKIAEKAFAQFQRLLEHQTAARKYMYINWMRRDLNAAKNQGKGFCSYYEHLIDVVEDEWRYVNSVNFKNQLTIGDVLAERQMRKKFPKSQKSLLKAKPDLVAPLAFCLDTSKGDNTSLVFQVLKDAGALAPETTVAQFRPFVSGQVVEKPLVWHAALGDLMVFIKELAKHGKITFPRNQQWNIAELFFIKPDGSRFNVNSLKVAQPTINAAKYIKAAQKF